MSRLTRKNEHLFSAVRLARKSVFSGFEDVTLIHNALPEVSMQEVTLKTQLFGKTLMAPLIINAITGGGSIPGKVNEGLATVARETGVAMAVGSQTIALEQPEYARSFKVVRKINPEGLIMANVGAGVAVERMKRAIEMVRADALQIHLNVPQELIMREGDTNFKGWADNIARIVRQSGIPVIVKEVGFGLSLEVVRRLKELGVKNFDIGGRGGTNFITIEGHRGGHNVEYLESWGITTAASLIETNSLGIADNIIATGGIRSPLDIIKAMALGANVAGIAGAYLKILFERKEEGLIRSIEQNKKEMARILIMTGVDTVARCRDIPVVVTGKTREWLTERGINTKEYAQRSFN